MQKKRIGFWRRREAKKEQVEFFESELLEDDDSAPIASAVESKVENTSKTASFKKEDVKNVAPEQSKAEIKSEENKAATETEHKVENADVEKDADAEVKSAARVSASRKNDKKDDNPPAPIEYDEEEEDAPAPVPYEEESEVAQKKQTARKAPTAQKVDEPRAETTAYRSKNPGTSTSIENRQSVRATLAATRFEIDNSQKAQIITNKPKETDPWAVATIVTKKPTAKSPAAKNKPHMEEYTTMAKEKAETQATAAKPAATKTSAPAAKATEQKPTTKAATQKVEAEPVVEAETSNSVSGKFIIKRTDKGNFVFKLFSSNGRVVAISAGQYTALSSCKAGIQSVINNAATAPIEDQTLQKVVEQKCPKWVIFTDKKGEARLRLIASNGNAVAATNDGYTTKDAAKKGIEAIARAAKDAEVVRNDTLW